MPIPSGHKLAHFEILEPIGKGGMGEVYRARDAKLARDVAIKLLPEEFSEDAERVRRLEREARLLARLNHPNIATLHGLEEHDSRQFLVMELVEGETLAERIARGPIAVPEALALFAQIAEGLAAAHKKGILHRDLKPANIKIGPDRALKILDFGLAKAHADESPSAMTTESPTVTRATVPGVILGTPSYLSPEQARGQELDERTDTWAFGAVLYEALTGKVAFPGGTPSDIIARILEAEPDWEALPRTTPDAVRRILKRALTKDRNRRLRGMADVAVELQEAIERPADPSFPPRKVSRRWIAALAALAALLAGLLYRGQPEARDPSVTRYALPVPTDVLAIGATGQRIALSPDGRSLVYAGRVGEVRQLFIRNRDRFEAQRIEGTEGALNPFFSPDGRWVGFLTWDYDGKLKKIPVAGGAAVTLCDAVDAYGGAWGDGGEIVFAPGGDGLYAVSEGGGERRRVTQVDEGAGEDWHGWPSFLPGGRQVLFAVGSRAGERVEVLDLDSGERRLVLDDASSPRFHRAPASLLFERDRWLHAVSFDPRTHEATGAAIPIVEVMSGDLGASRFDSRNGDLAYVVPQVRRRSLQWVERDGTWEPMTDEWRSYADPRMSPDGKRLLLTIDGGVWVFDIEEQHFTKLTFGDERSDSAIWVRGGDQVALYSHGAGIVVQNTDGTGAARVLPFPDVSSPTPATYASGADTILFSYQSSETGRDIWMTSLAADATPGPAIETEHMELAGSISPDGRYFAYVSNESGRYEVYVRDFPGLERKWQVSRDGGVQPVWSPRGDEIFYIQEGKLVAVPVSTHPAFRPGRPVVLLETDWDDAGFIGYANYDVTPDGKRFVMIRDEAPSELTEIRIVLGWSQELADRLRTND